MTRTAQSTIKTVTRQITDFITLNYAHKVKIKIELMRLDFRSLLELKLSILIHLRYLKVILMLQGQSVATEEKWWRGYAGEKEAITETIDSLDMMIIIAIQFLSIRVRLRGKEVRHYGDKFKTKR